MDISKQVINLSQAKKLKELGVAQNANFWWTKINNQGKENDFWLLPVCQFTKFIRLDYTGVIYPDNAAPWINDKKEGEKIFDYEKYSAFTVAELGEMLPRNEYGTYKDDFDKWQCFPLDRQGFYDEYRDGNTEAEARGEMLIHLLETKLLSVEEVNKRI